MIKCLGFKGWKSFMSFDKGHNGREFKTASISAATVDDSSKVREVNPITFGKWVSAHLTAAFHKPLK